MDNGIIEPDYKEILNPGKVFALQKITINGEALNDRVTAVLVLNKMYKARR